MNKLMNQISSPQDLKRLSVEEMSRLANEVRAYILDVISKNGGHLSANLGVVELTLALHRVFDAPRDKIIWDVGHQCYTHKILTGRRERFRTLRQFNGILGFPSREESEYDVYNTGHASTALSAALGLAVARDKKKQDYKVIAVVGDGSLTGGVSWEALNQIGHLRVPLIIVLNYNEMSISPSVGAMSKYLSYLASGQHYIRAKDRAKTLLRSIPILGWPILRAGKAVEELFKKTFFPGLVFEELGLKYVGPVQGHSLASLIEVFEEAKAYKEGPILIHTVTRKGLGFPPAQDNPERFHGASPFNLHNGEALVQARRPTFSSIFGETLMKIAKRDPRVIAITAAMPEGTGLSHFAEQLTEQFFDVGIAEQHAVNFAAGLALNGMKPVCAIYSTFLQRAYDQVYHDVCLQDIPIVFVLDRAGIVSDDGPTHQGVNDIAYLRHMPNLILMAPRDENELQHQLGAAFGYGHPVAIRIPKGEAVGVPMDPNLKPVPLGQAELLKEGEDLLLAYGSMVYPALAAAKELEKEGIRLAVVDAKFAKPLDEPMISRFAAPGRTIMTVEEGVLSGGFGSAVRELLDNRRIFGIRFKAIGIPLEIYPLGKAAEIKRLLGLDKEGLVRQIKDFYKP